MSISSVVLVSLFPQLIHYKLVRAFTVLASALILSSYTLEQIPANRPAQISDIVDVIGNFIKILTPIAAVAFLIMLIWGGYQLIFSGGDPKAAAGARTTLTFAIIGVLLVIVSWLILLLIWKITNVNVIDVHIPGL